MLTPSLCAMFGCKRKPVSCGLCREHAQESALRPETTAQKIKKKKSCKFGKRR